MKHYWILATIFAVLGTGALAQQKSDKGVTYKKDGVVVIDPSIAEVTDDGLAVDFKMTRWGRYRLTLLFSGETEIGKQKASFQLNGGNAVAGEITIAKEGKSDPDVEAIYFEKSGPAKLAVTLAGHAKKITGVVLLPTTEGKTQEQDGDTFALHARDSIIHGTMLRYEPNPKKLCAGFWTMPEDQLEWQFTLKKPGRYKATLHQGCGKGHGGSDVDVVSGSDSHSFVVKDTGHFQNFVPIELGEFTWRDAGLKSIWIKPKNKKKVAVMDVQQIVLERVGDATDQTK